MFDWYVVRSISGCPRCGAPLDASQSKEGPCDLLVFEEGRAGASSHDVDPPWARPAEDLAAVRLPEGELRVDTRCARGHSVHAVAIIEGGVWRHTRVEWPAYPDDGTDIDRWITATAVATRAPTARIRCPECGDDDLLITDASVEGSAERWLRCPSCRACDMVPIETSARTS